MQSVAIFQNIPIFGSESNCNRLQKLTINRLLLYEKLDILPGNLPQGQVGISFYQHGNFSYVFR